MERPGSWNRIRPLRPQRPPSRRSRSRKGGTMEFFTPANTAITGAGNQTTGFNALGGWHLAASAAMTLSIRETSGAGTIIAQRVFAAAGQWDVDFGHPLR